MKTIWIARDKIGYCLYNREPEEEDWFRGAWVNWQDFFCVNDFEGMTGLKLEPGQFQKVKLVPGQVYYFED